MKRRNGFTIVEMLMVIAVLAVLMAIVTTAASAAIRKGRSNRASAMAGAVQAGIATYNAQNDAWPGVIEQWAKDGKVSGNDSNLDGGDRTDVSIGSLSDSDYDKLMQVLLTERRSGRPVMDFGALLAGPSSAGNGKQNGLDYRTWIQRMKASNKTGKNKLPAGMQNESSITFGYAGTQDGKFYRFKITYNANTDSVTVSTR